MSSAGKERFCQDATLPVPFLGRCRRWPRVQALTTPAFSMSDKKLNLLSSSYSAILRRLFLQIRLKSPLNIPFAPQLPPIARLSRYTRLCISTPAVFSQSITPPIPRNPKSRKTPTVFLPARYINLALKNDLDFPVVKLATFAVVAVPIRPLLGTALSFFCGTTTRPP